MKKCDICNLNYENEKNFCKKCGKALTVVTLPITVDDKFNETKKCPFCAETINALAIKCKHCGEWLNKKSLSNIISCDETVHSLSQDIKPDQSSSIELGEKDSFVEEVSSDIPSNHYAKPDLVKLQDEIRDSQDSKVNEDISSIVSTPDKLANEKIIGLEQTTVNQNKRKTILFVVGVIGIYLIGVFFSISMSSFTKLCLFPNQNQITVNSPKANTYTSPSNDGSYILPNGYSAFLDSENRECRVDKDFDNDGILDLAIVATKSTDSNFVFIFLSSIFSKNMSCSFMPIDISTGYDLSFEKSILSIGACLGMGRYCETYKFRYSNNIEQMRLIGYDEENFGNALHEGAYKKSINLLTNHIEIVQFKFNEKTENDDVINKIKNKVEIPLYTIEDLNQNVLDKIKTIGNKYFIQQ